jgi:riboflavin kinase
MDWSALYEKEHSLSEPCVLSASVIHGFNRGSKELGIPTANLNMEELGAAGESLETGIYYGVAKLDNVEYNSVVSVGWNPFYKNEKKTVEAHLLSQLPDFYDKMLEVTLLGYLRPETNFKSLGKTLVLIQSDMYLRIL